MWQPATDDWLCTTVAHALDTRAVIRTPPGTGGAKPPDPPVDHTPSHELSPYFKGGPRCARCGANPERAIVSACRGGDHRGDNEYSALLLQGYRKHTSLVAPTPVIYSGPLSMGLNALGCHWIRGAGK